MRKVMTIVGTRPELIKMSRVIPTLDRHTNHVLVHTGQNYDFELNQIFFDELQIRKPDFFLGAAGRNSASTIAQVIEKCDELLEQQSPDAVMLYGDTNSCLSVIAAKRRKIPVFHMEAGNRCFDQRVPEELNRKILDHLSDVNLVLTEHARRNLLAEGLPSDRIFKTGSHLREVLNFYRPQIAASDVLTRLELQKGAYFVVSAHREENVDSPDCLRAWVASLEALVNEFSFPVVVSTHPRTRGRLEALELLPRTDQIRYVKPFGFFDYIHLQSNAFCVLSDSGTVTEEASLLGFPAVTLRNAHERPEGMDAGTLIMSQMEPDSVVSAVRAMTTQRNDQADICVADYANANVSTQILRIVLSYIDFINRTVWHKV